MLDFGIFFPYFNHNFWQFLSNQLILYLIKHKKIEEKNVFNIATKFIIQ